MSARRAAIALAWMTLAAASHPARADETGRPGFQSLNLGTSARIDALGETGTTLADGADALDWNPARLLRTPGVSASVSYFNWLDDIEAGHAAIAFPVGRTAIGIQGRSLAVPEFDNTTFEEPVDQSDLAIGAGAATSLTPRCAIGVGAKLVRSTLAEEDASGWAVDAGVDYRWSRGWDAAVALRNFGPAIAYGDGPEDRLPTQVRGGVAGTLRRFRFGVEGVWENGPGGFGTVGAEYRLRNILALRAGSRVGGPERLVEPWSLGAGIDVRKGLGIDYSFHDGDVAASHRLGVRWASMGFAPSSDQVLSAKDFYHGAIDKSLEDALRELPGDPKDTLVVRPAKTHEAADVVAGRVADWLRARGRIVDLRPVVPDIPDSVRQARAAELESKGWGKTLDKPLLEVEVRSSAYRYGKEWRERWIGPKTVEREATVDLGFAWRAAGAESASWTSGGTATLTEVVEADRIPNSRGYPSAPATVKGGKPNPFVEPAIVGGIVAGLAALFFSNRNVGD